MKKRILSLLLALCMTFALLPAAVTPASAADETLFDRYIPIAQVYSSTATPYGVKVGKSIRFKWGTQLVDENYQDAYSVNYIKRNEYYGHFLKVTYLGTFGSLDKAAMMTLMGYSIPGYDPSETPYNIAMGTQAAEGNYEKTIDKNSIIVKVDLYDANKKLVRNVTPGCAILAVGPDGEFLTYSARGGKGCSLLFSMQDNLCDITVDQKTSLSSIEFTPTYTWLADKSVAEALLGSKSSAPVQSDYQFTPQPELNIEKPQYMTNNIISGTEFIDPFGTYYQVGCGTGLDPVIKNKIENVVDYSEYGRAVDIGVTERSILTADGTLYGVNTHTGEKRVLATGVKQAGKAHYMTADGTVKEIPTGKVVATNCAAFAEHRYAKVIGVLKKDGTFYLGYTYLAEAEGLYERGLEKKTVDNGKTDKFKAVVPGGVVTEDNRFYRWWENVIGAEYDENKFWAGVDQGIFEQEFEYKLGLMLVTNNAARVFPYEYYTAQESTAEDACTGFVVNEDGYVWAFGLQNWFQLTSDYKPYKMGMVRHIFPIYTTKGKFADNAHLVAFLTENSNRVQGLIANHCTMNMPVAGEFPTPDYLSDVPNGYRGVNGNTYTLDMEASKSFTMKPTALHHLNDQLEMFFAMDTSTKPTTNMELLPNVVRSSYNIDNEDNGTVLLERSDGSMWMVQLWSRVTAADKVAKLGGWENSNVFQITQPTTKVSGRCDYVDLVGGEGSTVVNRGPVDAPDTKPAAYVNDSHYVNLSPYQAEMKYQNGEKFVLMVCISTCGWCKRLKSGLPATLSAADYSIYGVTDDSSAVSFYWDFVRGDTLGTPFVVIVNGKDDVEVVSAIHSQSAMAAALNKAKAKGIPSASATSQTTPTTPTTPTVAAKRPSDKLSVSAYEWEVLKLTNQERYKAGLSLLSMPAALQTASNIRENELLTSLNHTRPNGQRPETAIDSSFKWTIASENIAAGQRNPQEVMSGWMNSPGHKANILEPDHGYIGVGATSSTPYHWVQLFTDAAITSVTSSSGSLTFASEEAMQGEYLICTGKNGVESYLPIDVSVMTKSGNSYTLKLPGKTVTLNVGASIPATGTAYPATQTIDLDGKKVEFQMYQLRDADGNGTNYVKIRDLALALNGTAAQFAVDYDGSVDLVAGKPYTPNGSENKTPFSGERTYSLPGNPTKVNSSVSDLQAIVLTDDSGGGYTYYKLRDLGSKLGFNVDWSVEKGVFIETNKPYSGK